jgi:hypothetical protein
MGIAVSPQIHPQVAEFIDKPRKMLINGKWINAASGKTFPTYNPATGEVLAQIAEGDRDDIDQAVKAARKAFDNGPWRRMTAAERGRLMWKLSDLLEQHTEEFGYIESLDNGKPLNIAKAADVPLAVDMFRYMAGWATKLEGNTIPLSVPYTPGAQYLAYTLREPVGVVGQIIPWNFSNWVANLRTWCSRTPISTPPLPALPARFSLITASAAAPVHGCTSRSRSTTVWLKALLSTPRRSKLVPAWNPTPRWARSFPKSN